ncbi:MAG: transcriptional repressor LexA [Candidatus Aminicenantaceae bacterium]
MVNRRSEELTARQKKVLEAIKRFILEHGYSPTIRQLGNGVGISSPSAVFKHIASLQKKGYLRKQEGKIKLKGLSDSLKTVTKVPLVGFVPAGQPKEVFDFSDEVVDVPDWMIGKKQGNVFCIQIDGKSMIDAYIDDGDRVLVERTDTANSGEVIVALLDDGSVTLKRLKIENGNIFLIPENPDFKPIQVKELRILGRVVGVLRKY